MKYVGFAFTLLFGFHLISCGPSAEEKARQQKLREDSLVNAALLEKEREAENKLAGEISEIETQIEKAREELAGLNNDPGYLYVKTRLATVRARVSTGASYGWIDKDGKFWEGKDASKAFDEAAVIEANQLVKIKDKEAEIKSLEDQIKHLQDMKQD